MRASSSAPSRSLAAASARARPTRRIARTVRGAYSSGAASEEPSSRASDQRARGESFASSSGASFAHALERQIAVTTQLRDEFESDPFLSRSTLKQALAPNVEYNNDVHAVRGSADYRALMGHFGDATASALKRFKFVTRRASSIEPGVLLIQWTAEWDGVTFGKKFSNLLLSSMHEGAVQKLVEGEFGEKVAPGYPLADAERAKMDQRRDMKCRLFGRTTYKVNRDGLIVSRLDRVDFRTDPEPGSSEDDSSIFISAEEEEEELERLAEETAVNMFYNTLCPPGKNETSWFLDVLIELEWQSFQRQMGDTTSIISKQEYVNVIYTVMAGAVLTPMLFFAALAAFLTSPDAPLDPDSLDAAFTAAPLTGGNGSPLWGAEVFIDLYKGKIGL